MKLSAEDLYSTSVLKLSPKERWRLAIMILNDIVIDDGKWNTAILGRIKT